MTKEYFISPISHCERIMVKRLFDLVISGSLLILLSPGLLLISLAIKLTTPGKVFYIQKRVGKDGRLFSLIKFRTMNDSNSLNVSQFNLGDVSQVTVLGKWLRKSKLDELPQLINVLIGEMSIVGPRPEVEEWTKIYAHKWKIVHSIRPGITDTASILYRNEEELLQMSNNPSSYYLNVILPQKLDLYIKYAQNNNILSDICIIIKTIKKVITN